MSDKEIFIRAELEKLHNESDNGLLTAEQVVLAAKSPDSPLHSQFNWDDSSAAHQHRLWQARQLMARHRIIIEGERSITVPVRVSLLSDRENDGGGYRRLNDILQDSTLRQELLRTALQDLKSFQRRYSVFSNLISGVTNTIEAIEAEMVKSLEERV